MVPIDPDAPWGANLLLLLLIVGIIPAFTSWVTTRGTKKKLRAVAHDVAASRQQVENNHQEGEYPNLRDEITAIRTSVQGLHTGLQDVRDDVGGMRSEMRDMRLDIGGLRTDARRDRRNLSKLQRLADNWLGKVGLTYPGEEEDEPEGKVIPRLPDRRDDDLPPYGD